MEMSLPVKSQNDRLLSVEQKITIPFIPPNRTFKKCGLVSLDQERWRSAFVDVEIIDRSPIYGKNSIFTLSNVEAAKLPNCYEGIMKVE